MAKAGRPRKEIDKETFEKLCAIFCTEEEIAGFFKCDKRTLDRWCKREYGKNFVDVYKKYTAAGKMSLRRMQYKLAEKSPAMAIWLGKQYLGQTDYVKADVQADGRLADLIDGLKDDLHEETESIDGLVAAQPTEENKHP